MFRCIVHEIGFEPWTSKKGGRCGATVPGVLLKLWHNVEDYREDYRCMPSKLWTLKPLFLYQDMGFCVTQSCTQQRHNNWQCTSSIVIVIGVKREGNATKLRCPWHNITHAICDANGGLMVDVSSYQEMDDYPSSLSFVPRTLNPLPHPSKDSTYVGSQWKKGATNTSCSSLKNLFRIPQRIP